MDQLINIKEPDIKRKKDFFYLKYFLKKVSIFLEKVLSELTMTAVHKHLCTTNSICPIKATYSKYITPIKPHQKDPKEVSINPLLKCWFIK